MKEPVSVTVNLYSPRDGRNVELWFDITADKIEASTHGQGKHATCRWDDSALFWRGYHCESVNWDNEPSPTTHNALLNIIENEYVYPPTVFVGMLEGAWCKWRDGIVTDAQLSEELPKLFDWLNELTQIQPDDFWRQCP